MVKGLLKQGHNPIIFCRYIPTATYVARELGQALGDKVLLQCVTGLLDPKEREQRIAEMGTKENAGRPRLLVATDCLSEGINLQELFDSIVHYDLSWNPTRHEQREGRVDRYGQPAKLVRIITYYGKDNPVDGLVLEVLLRKHAEIRKKTGVGVSVPHDNETVVSSIMEGLLLRRKAGGTRQDLLPGLEDLWKPRAKAMHASWESNGEKEGRLRSMFAQEAIRVEDLKSELEASQKATGSDRELAEFVRDTLRLHGGTAEDKDGDWVLDYKETPHELMDRLEAYGDAKKKRVAVRFNRPVKDGVLLLARTHPLIEELAGFVSESALDGIETARARRAGTMRTKAVSKRSTLLLLRFRHDLETTFKDKGVQVQLAEELGVMAFEGAPETAAWLTSEQAEVLWQAQPSGNVGVGQAQDFVSKVADGLGVLKPAIEAEATRRAEELRQAHSRVRQITAIKGRPARIQGYKVIPRLPVDILGIYVLLPHVA
jgi:superfamily II DNA/RNA helicase